MPENKPLDIVKSAMLLEHKGRALYRSVVKTTEIEGVRELFSLLAEEENRHIAMLQQQYALVVKGESFDPGALSEHAEAAEMVLSAESIEQISGAGYEAAVISAALEFEKKAVAYYSERAEKTEDEKEREIFRWLADWEKTHMQMLARLDDDLRERIWFDNQFWPLA